MNKFTLPINSVDFAALLYTLGFEMKDFEILHHIKMEERNKREKTAIFEFSDTSESGLTLQSVKNNYAFPPKNKKASHIAQFAKICAHNYQVLKSVVRDNRPLQQIKGENYCILKNMNGSDVIGDETDYHTTDLSIVAIASALGFEISTYSIADGILTVYYTESIQEIVDKWLTDDHDDDYGYLSVLINTCKNRNAMMEETYAKQTLHLSSGYKQVLLPKNCSEELKKKITEFLN